VNSAIREAKSKTGQGGQRAHAPRPPPSLSKRSSSAAQALREGFGESPGARARTPAAQGISENPVPKPTVRPGTGSSWEVSDVRAVLCNPVNAGLGPFKHAVPEDLWLKAAEKQVAEYGAEQYLVNVLFMLKESFKRVQGHPPRDVSLETDYIIATDVGPFPRLILDEQWVRASAAKLRDQGVTRFMRDQLRKMRETLLGTGLTLPE
jgi:hypothetical protein